MTACIVGWSHLPFGKHDDRSAESLIVEAATAAIADAGLTPAESTRSGSAISTAASSPRTSPARWCCRPTLPCASSPRPGSRTPVPPARPPCMPACARSRPARRGSCWSSGVEKMTELAGPAIGDTLLRCSYVERGGRHRGRLRRRVRPDRADATSSATATSPTRWRRSPPRTTRTAAPTPGRRCARTWATSSAAPSPRRTRSSPARSSAPTARWSPTVPRPWC